VDTAATRSFECELETSVEVFDGFAIPGLSSRMVAEFAEVAERKDFFGCGDPDTLPNGQLTIPFRSELIHSAAQSLRMKMNFKA
jgi:hypothetical protein